jgi:hypothetical protein
MADMYTRISNLTSIAGFHRKVLNKGSHLTLDPRGANAKSAEAIETRATDDERLHRVLHHIACGATDEQVLEALGFTPEEARQQLANARAKRDGSAPTPAAADGSGAKGGKGSKGSGGKSAAAAAAATSAAGVTAGPMDKFVTSGRKQPGANGAGAGDSAGTPVEVMGDDN